MNRASKVLISYTGRETVDVDFAPAVAAREKAYRQACNKAKAAKQQPPPEVEGKFHRATSGQALSLRPRTTATVTGDELAYIKEAYPGAFRWLVVHPKAVDKPSRAERKAAREKGAEEAPAEPFPPPPPPESDKDKGKGKGKGKVARTG